MESELEKVAWFQYFALLLIKKKTKFCKQQKIGDSDVVNKLLILKGYFGTVKLGDKAWFDKEQIGAEEPLTVTNMLF